MSFFDEVETTVANTRFLQAQEEKQPVNLQFEEYSSLSALESKLREGLTVQQLLKPRTTGCYLFTQFLKEQGEDDALHLLSMLEDFTTHSSQQRIAAAKEIFGLHTPLVPTQLNEANLTSSVSALPITNASTNMVIVEQKSNSSSFSSPILNPEDDTHTYPLTSCPCYRNIMQTVLPSSHSLCTRLANNPQTAALLTSLYTIYLSAASAASSSSSSSSSTNSAILSPTSSSTTSSSVTTLPPSFFKPLQHQIYSLLQPHFERFIALSGTRQSINGGSASSENAVALSSGAAAAAAAAADGSSTSSGYPHPLYMKWVQVSAYAHKVINLDSFKIFRVLGRGAFGAVSAVQKQDTQNMYAMKEMAKKQVKHSQSEWMVINEKEILQEMCETNSPFVLSLKYSFHDEENSYLIFDICSGGDLKFHLKSSTLSSTVSGENYAELLSENAFTIERAQFYTAEILLGLEALHQRNIVYRDLKPNNILLDMNGHVKISDLGLTIKLKKDKILKHLAGTAGYWAPEIVMKSGTFLSSDYWSLGVMLYEMLAGKRPACNCNKKGNGSSAAAAAGLEWCPFGQTQKMETNAQSAQGVLKLDVVYPPERFSPEAKDLLEKLFEPDPHKRLGGGPDGLQEIKRHPFFASLDWDALAHLEITPSFIPDPRSVNANTLAEVGEFNRDAWRKIEWNKEEDNKIYANFNFASDPGLQLELTNALIKMDSPENALNIKNNTNSEENTTGCCCIIS